MWLLVTNKWHYGLLDCLKTWKTLWPALLLNTLSTILQYMCLQVRNSLNIFWPLELMSTTATKFPSNIAWQVSGRWFIELVDSSIYTILFETSKWSFFETSLVIRIIKKPDLLSFCNHLNIRFFYKSALRWYPQNINLTASSYALIRLIWTTFENVS